MPAEPPARPGPAGRPALPSWAGETPGAGRGGWTRRRRVRALIALAVVVFIAISGLLARFLQVENVERDADLRLVQAQARGDAQGMLDQLSGCRSSASCVAAVRADASNARLVRKGSVKILQLTSPTAYSLFGATGRTRLAWTVIGTLPVVQCVTVRRTGDFLSGIKLELSAISAPIPNEADC